MRIGKFMRRALLQGSIPQGEKKNKKKATEQVWKTGEGERAATTEGNMWGKRRTRLRETPGKVRDKQWKQRGPSDKWGHHVQHSW